jgi:hypothetical protein
VSWSAQQVLRTSKLHEVAKRADADLVFQFTLLTQPTKPLSVTSNERIPVSNTVTLEVLNETEVAVWKESEEWREVETTVPFLQPMRTSEKARAEFLRSHPPAALVDRFLKDLSR